MAEMLLLNPRRRRKAKRASTGRKRARRASSHRRARRHNPITAHHYSPVRRRRHARRRNPIRARRRRHNPIGGRRGAAKSMVSMFMDALVGGAGAIAFDVVMGQVNKFLPASLQTTPTSVGVGDAIKAALTAATGHYLGRKFPIVRKAAQGALTVQARDILSLVVPTGALPLGGHLGWSNPAKTIPGNARVGPMRTNPGMGAYMAPGGGRNTPLLSAYQGPGQSPLLSNSQRIMNREGVRYR